MTQDDLDLLKQMGISEEKLLEQLECFKNGFPFLKVVCAATVEDGILHLSDKSKDKYISIWRDYLAAGHDVLKFTPASGAASRMFKDLFAFRDRGGEPQTEFEQKFISEIQKFAFYEQLNKVCLKNDGKNVMRLITEKRYTNVLDALLEQNGLNYRFLPKGLIQFHKNNKGVRTAFEEHLAEGAMYAKNKNGIVRLHFTVSEDHLTYFNRLLSEKIAEYEYNFGVQYDVTFSVQSHSTDTIAVDENNEPFRSSNGKMVFRPGGHGALIQNLNEIDAEIIFIKNIDNVVPDALKQPTVEYKAMLAGVLVEYQEKMFKYLKKLNSASVSDKELEEIEKFVVEKLNVDAADCALHLANKIEYLKKKLDRPIRVCGMVKNEGEPGGGPYVAVNPDGSHSLQILESAQFDKNDPEQMHIFKEATHFNPVDLVCGVKDYKGDKYDLTKFVDPNTGFISSKSKDGKALKALELPGLWNGAMSDWNTIFVEVPINTFNPVKTVNDLLRKEHQM